MVLKVGAEVFDDSCFFFGGALVVEVDEFFEELVVGEALRPAVGFEDGVVELFRPSFAFMATRCALSKSKSGVFCPLVILQDFLCRKILWRDE